MASAHSNVSSEFVKSYNSFSGCDIRATFGNRVIGALQGISWSISREKAPIYTMGEADPRAFARGKRGIAGSLVFIQFDRHVLLQELGETLFWADRDSFKPDASNSSILTVDGGPAAARTIFEQETRFAEGTPTDPREDQKPTRPWFADQLPPFDITLTAANEYGAAAIMRIYGCEILNEGSGTSIDDIVLEQQCTYVCRSISPWAAATPAYKSPTLG